MVPVPAHVLQLVGLVINPVPILRPHTLSNHPDPVVLTAKKVATKAWSFLHLILTMNRPYVLLRCLPGHNGTTERNCNSRAQSDLDIVSSDVLNDLECHQSVKRIIEASNVWEILVNSEVSSRPIVTPGGWDLLTLLVMAWEIDLNNLKISDSVEIIHQLPDRRAPKTIPRFPHFLRQFNPASTGGFRLDPRALDVVFEPFRSHSNSATYSWGRAVNTRMQAQELSIRLLHLLERLDNNQLIEPGRLREDVINQMRALETPDLHTFVNVLPADPILRIRLLSRFLESVTRSSGSAVGLVPPDTSCVVPSLSSPCSSLSSISNSPGLRRTKSRSSGNFDERGSGSSISGSKSHFLSLSSLVTQLLPRPLLEIPTKARSNSVRVDPKILLNAESRYFAALNVILESLLTLYKEKATEIDRHGLKLVKEQSLRTAIDAIFDSTTSACGTSLYSLGDEKTFRSLQRRKVNRTINAFENLARNF